MAIGDLFKPKWKHSSPLVREEAVKKLNDQEKLIEIAKTDSSFFVRGEAVKKINDESILIDIAKNDSNSGVRGEAVKKINDESILIDIAKNDSNFYVRREAVKKINDQSVLVNISKYDLDSSVRMEAAKKIDDDSVLISIAKNDSDFSTRIDAISKINDMSALIDIAQNNSYGIKDAAIDRIKILDPTSIAFIEPETVSNIDDQTTLKEIIKDAVNSLSRARAVEKITDENILSELALNDNDYYVRLSAVRNENLKNRAVLKKVAKNDPYYSLGHPVYESVDSYKIIEQPKQYSVRDAAKERLKK